MVLMWAVCEGTYTGRGSGGRVLKYLDCDRGTCTPPVPEIKTWVSDWLVTVSAS